MKLRYSFLLLLLPSCTCAAKPVSIERFRKITSAEEREKMIEQASPEQRDELEKIDNHLMLLAYDKRKGIQGDKESAIAQARGFKDLENLFMGWANLWSMHAGDIINMNCRSGMTREEQLEIEKRLDQKLKALAARQREVHDLVFRLAASSQALVLEKKAEKVAGEISERSQSNAVDSTPLPIVQEERSRWDEQLNRMFEKMKRLPTLTPAQLQREYDAFPEGRIYQKMTRSGAEQKLEIPAWNSE